MASKLIETGMDAAMRSISMLLFFSLIMTLGGCASRMEISLSEGLRTSADDGVGVLVVSMGRSRVESSWPPHQVHQIGFAKRGGSGKQSGTIFSSLTEPRPPDMDVADDQLVLKVMTVRLPPGDYEIIKGHMSTDTGTYYSSEQSRDGVSIPFRIEEDKATYLGRFVAIGVDAGKNVFGMQLNRGVFVISDALDEDLRLLRNRSPEVLGDLEVIPAVPDFSGALGGMFIVDKRE